MGSNTESGFMKMGNVLKPFLIVWTERLLKFTRPRVKVLKLKKPKPSADSTKPSPKTCRQL